jgi:hypothetical protein
MKNLILAAVAGATLSATASSARADATYLSPTDYFSQATAEAPTKTLPGDYDYIAPIPDVSTGKIAAPTADITNPITTYDGAAGPSGGMLRRALTGPRESFTRPPVLSLELSLAQMHTRFSEIRFSSLPSARMQGRSLPLDLTSTLTAHLRRLIPWPPAAPAPPDAGMARSYLRSAIKNIRVAL